ncbi:MAG: hypothetical protein AB4040_02390 [Synechococcus sp.]
MNSQLKLAIVAVAIAGSAAIVSTPAHATPEILTRLDEIQAKGSSSENGAGSNPFVDQDKGMQGVEVAGEPMSVSDSRSGSRNSSLVGRLQELRSTSPESGI